MGVRFNFDSDRALAAIVYVASKNPKNLDVYKMCKLIFLGDKLHLVRFGRPITGDDMRAMDYGPVPSVVYDWMKDLVAGNGEDERVRMLSDHLAIDTRYEHPHFSCSKPIDFEDYLSRSDIDALDEIVTLHGAKGFEELKVLTHAMPSWKNAWDDPRRTTRNPLMAIEDLFLDDSEALVGAKEEMIEDFEIRQAVHASI
jgi:uncharacterized phage-associated protein